MKREVDEPIDLWAVGVVVREQNRRVQLNRTEKRLAAHLFKIKGITAMEAGEILGVSNDLVLKFQKLDPPVALHTIPNTMIGNRVVQESLITREAARHGMSMVVGGVT